MPRVLVLWKEGAALMCDCDCHKSGRVCDCREPKPALRVGQKVQLTGTVLRRYDDEFWEVQVEQGSTSGLARGSALTPVVEPEPQVREDEICADERRRLAVLLRAHVKTLSTFTADKEATVLLCALMLELSGHKAAVLHKEPSDG